jgi:hypothetical protein
MEEDLKESIVRGILESIVRGILVTIITLMVWLNLYWGTNNINVATGWSIAFWNILYALWEIEDRLEKIKE